jgi:crotonobetainyl-CoA:carnitine CoA-transferase CaiB-like acyl-CoA transferase
LITNGNLRVSLEDVVIVEVGDQMGDYAALLLAGLGAEVIKLEPPTGSPSRSVGPFASAARNPEESIFFWRYNLNKKSAVLDFDNPVAPGALTRLLAKTDILLLAGEFTAVQRRLEQCGQIAKDNPCLVQCVITPFRA